MKKAELCNLLTGSIFIFPHQKDRIWTLCDTIYDAKGNVDFSLIKLLMFKGDLFWHEAKGANPERCNPYANVYLFDLENIP